MEGQDLSLKPVGLNGPRTFVSSSDEITVKFLALANKIYRENEIGYWRAGMTVEISFTAVPKADLINLVGLLLLSHMGLCQFMNHDSRQNNIWIYCPNPDVPDCVHMSLFCEKNIQCATDEESESLFGLDRGQCNKVSYSNRNNVTDRQKTLWKLWDQEVKTQGSTTSLKLEVTQLIVIAAGAAVTGIFVAVSFWRIFSCWEANNSSRKQKNANNMEKEQATEAVGSNQQESSA